MRLNRRKYLHIEFIKEIFTYYRMMCKEFLFPSHFRYNKDRIGDSERKFRENAKN